MTREREWEIPASEDRVRANTSPGLQARMDRQLSDDVRAFALKSKAQISRRILELEQEWDIERWIELNSSSLALTGIVLSIVRDRRWIILSGLVTAFLLQHAVQGWCPPIPLLRRLGIRTRQEIARELYALKALRGDFEGIKDSEEPRVRAQMALDAALDY